MNVPNKKLIIWHNCRWFYLKLKRFKVALKCHPTLFFFFMFCSVFSSITVYCANLLNHINDLWQLTYGRWSVNSSPRSLLQEGFCFYFSKLIWGQMNSTSLNDTRFLSPHPDPEYFSSSSRRPKDSLHHVSQKKHHIYKYIYRYRYTVKAPSQQRGRYTTAAKQ